MSEFGLKLDQGKQQWYAMPLKVIQLLANVFAGGEKKYATFNCLKPFEDSDRRFWDGTMRHLEKCQLDPTAIDQELLEEYGVTVHHGAQAAWNILMRTYHALEREHGREKANEAFMRLDKKDPLLKAQNDSTASFLLSKIRNHEL